MKDGGLVVEPAVGKLLTADQTLATATSLWDGYAKGVMPELDGKCPFTCAISHHPQHQPDAAYHANPDLLCLLRLFLVRRSAPRGVRP